MPPGCKAYKRLAEKLNDLAPLSNAGILFTDGIDLVVNYGTDLGFADLDLSQARPTPKGSWNDLEIRVEDSVGHVSTVRIEPAFAVTLTGVWLERRLGEDAGFGRKSRGLKVTADGAADYVERVLRSYLEHREEGDRFATWARRADEALLK
mgnify:CR=1 FL=1